MIPAAQIEDDLARLAQITECVRTYSVDFGLDQIAGIAAKHGLKVMQGLWLSSSQPKNAYQIETAIALANKYPGTIRSLVIGNEVLLRGEMTATDLASTIRAIKARVKVPVTYADVWEFWLRNTEIANVVDFITISYFALLGGFSGFGTRCRGACGGDPPTSGQRISGEGGFDR